jgi:hypothetical protein
MNITPEEAWAVDADNPEYVAIPWVNNTTGLLQNAVNFNGMTGQYEWVNPTWLYLSYMPYLLYLLRRICEVMGYVGEFSALEASPYKFLLVCNALPGAWGAKNFALSLPHWTLTEFFEQLEVFLAGEFVINHKARTVSFRFLSDIAYNTPEVFVERVVNKYTVEVAKEASTEYLGRKNLVYANNDNIHWIYRDCQWYIDEHKGEAVVFDTMQEMKAFAQTVSSSGYSRTPMHGGFQDQYWRGYKDSSEGNKLFYVREVDTYFIMWCYRTNLLHSTEWDGQTLNWYVYFYRPEPVNQFGKFIVDREAEDLELGIVPAWIEDTDETYGPCVFLDCGEMGSAVSWIADTDEEGNSTGNITGNTGRIGGGRRAAGAGSTWQGQGSDELDEVDYNNGAFAQSRTAKAIANGETEKENAYFDCLYVGFFDSAMRQYGYLPHPIIDKLTTDRAFEFEQSEYSMRLTDLNARLSVLARNIDPKKKYNFSFLSDGIPDPRAVFYIEGSRYVCEKITATFHEGTGKSQLLKGVFYKIAE